MIIKQHGFTIVLLSKCDWFISLQYCITWFFIRSCLLNQYQSLLTRRVYLPCLHKSNCIVSNSRTMMFTNCLYTWLLKQQWLHSTTGGLAHRVWNKRHEAFSALSKINHLPTYINGKCWQMLLSLFVIGICDSYWQVVNNVFMNRSTAHL